MVLPWKFHKTIESVLKEHYKNIDGTYAKDFASNLKRKGYAEIKSRRGGVAFKARKVSGGFETKKYKGD